VDLTRTTVYILLPLSFILALILVSQGVVQTFKPYATVAVVQPTEYDEPVTDKDGKPVLDAKGTAHDQEVQADRASHRGGAGGLADRDQAARDQRGGFFNVKSPRIRSRTRRRCRTSSSSCPFC